MSADLKFERISLDHPLGHQLLLLFLKQPRSPQIFFFLFDPQNDFKKLGNIIKKEKFLAYFEKSEDVAVLAL